MFYFLNTLGLLAVAGVVLPVIIHLWNKKEGKTLKIGSVQLLVETARQQARSLRLKDLLLLLLRCSIIGLLAMLLAKPVWQKQLTTKDKKGWIVMDGHNGEAYKNYKSLIDSLMLTGFEAHYFKADFPLAKPADTAHSIFATDTLAYWALLKALNEQVTDDLPVYLFTTNQLSKFNGSRPLLAMNLKWFTYAAADTATGNKVAARLLAIDSIGTTVVHSTANYTAYFQKNNPLILDKIQQLKPGATNDANSLLLVDTSILHIGIFSTPLSNDATYLEAALNAIRQFGQYRMQIETITDPNRLASSYDWVFWLSQTAVPAILQTSHLFVYEKGKEKSMYSWLHYPLASTNTTGKIALTKGIIADSNSVSETVWSDGFGESVLSVEYKENCIYHFYSRFDAAWNGLVWSEEFPSILFDLILKKHLPKNRNDNRTISFRQMQPEFVKFNALPAKSKFLETTDLSKMAWSFSFLLFALERIISLNQKKEKDA